MPDFKNSLEVLKNIKHTVVNTESENIDYKLMFKFSDKKDKLELVKDIVSFANTEGGYIVFGVKDKEYLWVGLDNTSTIKYADDSFISPFLSQYVDITPCFQIGRYELDEETFILITIDRHIGDPIVFVKNGEYERTKVNGKQEKMCVFKTGDIYGRVKSSSTRVNDDKSFLSLRSSSSIISNLAKYPRPYKYYVDRSDNFTELFESLNNDRIRCAQINGLGGIGKTSFVRNFCDRIESGDVSFEAKTKYIVWITGKLDQFLSTGYIDTLRETELSFDELIDVFVEVLSIDTFDKSEDELQDEILDKLSKYNALIVLDNMETISDERILKFTRSIPLNCKIIFTTRTNMTDTYKRIDLVGFDEDQFVQYIDYCLDEYAPKRKASLKQTISDYLDDLIVLVQGSPILVNLIIYKICNGGSVEVIVDNLRNMKKNNSYYDSVMDFCFKSTFDNLNILEKKLLFAMSISDINREEFTVQDLSYIIKADQSDVNSALMTLFSSSFCIQINQSYVCQPLIKIFANKRLSDGTSLPNRESISGRYYEWSKTKKQINSYENSLFNKARAFTFERKKAYLKTKDIKQKYDAGEEYDAVIKEINKLIQELPDYGYLYFFKAEIEKNAEDSVRQIREDYELSIKHDKSNDFFYAEYAYYLSLIKDYESAISYFEQALSICDLQNYHFGLAVALSKFYGGRTDRITKSEMILNHFEKAYYTDEHRGNMRRNGRTADAHARYLRSLGLYDEAIKICEYGLRFSPRDEALLTLKGTIMKKIDPNYVSDTQIRNIKKGVFSRISEDDAKKLLDIYNDNSN